MWQTSHSSSRDAFGGFPTSICKDEIAQMPTEELINHGRIESSLDAHARYERFAFVRANKFGMQTNGFEPQALDPAAPEFVQVQHVKNQRLA
jgi:hypothetical protein